MPFTFRSLLRTASALLSFFRPRSKSRAADQNRGNHHRSGNGDSDKANDKSKTKSSKSRSSSRHSHGNRKANVNADPDLPPQYYQYELSPEEGKILNLRTLRSKLILTLQTGELLMLPEELLSGPEKAGARWECEEVDGWTRFRNAVSGTYLGRCDSPVEKKHGCSISTSGHGYPVHRNFTVRRRPEGGYVLWVKNGDKLDPVGYRFGKDGQVMPKVDRQRRGKQLVWEFVPA